MHATDTPVQTRGTLIIPALFVATIFLSASLLFFVQPLFTKIVLPQIGGSPAIWTTAMLFFQTVLIGGYLYAHLLTRHFPVRAQVWVHLGVWGAALAFLPLSIPGGWSFDAAGSPAFQTLMLFALGVGLPFFALSANAPLIQHWYGRSGGPSADDPYFLYGASNLGSLAALLGFPLLAEPLFGATSIGLGWAAGFIALGIFLLASGFSANAPLRAEDTDHARPAKPLTIGQIAHWAFLAFIPSSLMLAVTSKISLDVGSFPLVWVVPLALYLLTFVLAFSSRRPLPQRAFRALTGVVIALMLMAFLGLFGKTLSWAMAGSLVLGFFIVALFAHRKLYEARPEAAHLTSFYLTMSVGGALGGLFNSIVAPVLFDSLLETTVTAVLAVFLLIDLTRRDRSVPRALAKGGLYGAALGLPLCALSWMLAESNWTTLFSLMATAAIICVKWLRRDGVAIYGAAIVLLGIAVWQFPDDAQMRDRSFFGTHLVKHQDGLRIYGNGTTIHGAQRLNDDTAARPEPLFYYHPNGPMAQVMTSRRGQQARAVGIVGLGVGSLACYAQPHQDWQFYEIDALVDEVARNTDYFRFLSACTPDAPTHLGDARIVLAEQADVKYDILVIDAYSSDSVPVHLTTRDAVALYMDRLNDDGVLVFHISNRYYAIDRPLGRAAADLGLTARIQHYKGNLATDPGDSASTVVTLVRDPGHLGDLAQDARWTPLTSDGGRVWTDDFANLLSIMK